ncbi:uncharacterized protein [Littorina saxatilis]|uniref:Ig-like domain-containing protein n=1 Tax=Littorina saxatilis TaxID=31220 RepID=A0AAN9G8L1_9CAEN
MILTAIIFCVPFTLLGMTSAEPKLSLTATHDVTFTCDMSGFEGKMAHLLSLQIVKKRSGDRNVVFAFVDHSGVKPANHLGDIHPYHQLDGNFSIWRKRDSWLKLTIFKIDPNEDGVYACQIHHTAHPADTWIVTWERTVVVDTSDEAAPPRHPKGFSVSVRRSVHAVCEYEAPGNPPNSIKPVSYSALVKEDGTELASWSNNSANHITESRVSTIFVSVERMETSWKIIFEIPRNKCEESWKCHCTVQSFSDSSLTSSSQILPQHSCPHFAVGKKDPLPTSVPTKYNAVNTAGDAPLKHFTLGIFASVAVVVIIVAIVGLVIFCRKRAKRALCKTQRHTPAVDIDLSGQREPLTGQATTTTDTEDVDVDNDQKRQSLLSDSSDKVSVASSVLDLLQVRQETSNV